MPVGFVRDDERDARRQIHQHPGIELKIGVDRTDLQGAGRNQFRQPPALRSGKGKIESVRNAPLEDGKMIGERQDRLHHMQIMQALRVGFRERSRQEIGLLLVVTFDRDPVAGFDDRLEQFGSSLRWTDF